MPDIVLYTLILVISGIFAGFLAGLFGIGGGLVFIPVLFFLFVSQGMQEAAAMPLAVGTSLATIIFSASSSTLAHFRLLNIEVKILKLWGLPLICGVLSAAHLVEPRFGKVLVLVFVSLLLFIAINFYLDTFLRLPAPFARSRVLQACIAFIVGAISVMAGIGGGTLSVPVLVASGLTAHRSIGTSAALGLLISLPAVIYILLCSTTPLNAPAMTYGLINYSALFVLAVTSIFIAPFGAKMGKHLSETVLKRLFSGCLFVVALSMFMRTF